MLIEEARWFGRVLSDFPDVDVYPMLNVGSNTEAFRTKDQPWIDRQLFAPARDRGQTVKHMDLQEAPGVDLVGDLQDAAFLEQLAAARFQSVFCSNLLEHVPNREEIAAALVQIVPPGGCLFVSCPYRFPYHPDPIDTMFRPTVPELAGLFPGTSLVRETILNCGTMARFLIWDVGRGPLTFLGSAVKRMFRRSHEDRQVLTRGSSMLPWLFRRLRATCVVLRKH